MEIYFYLIPEIPMKIFPPKKCDLSFEGIPFWLHKILLSGLLKNCKETPKKTIFF
jgi:hypothetical protein